jgi:opacity protein-like surface antigen
MKTSTQTKLIACVGFVLCAGTLTAQKFIDSRLTFSVGYSVNRMMDNEIVTMGSYMAPSLVGNFKDGKSFELAASYKLNKIFYAQLGATNSGFWNWSYTGQNRFNDAFYSLVALHPEFEIRTPFKERGMFNYLSFFARLGPALGLHAITLQRSPFTPGTTTDFDFNRSRFYSTGFSVTAGANIVVANKMVLSLSYGLTRYAISSPLFDDETLTFSSLKVRVGYRFALNKRYKYAPRWLD